ncbi:hypothetical protein GCM10009809_00770 [Isoptericola hypogeus]|uniref:Tat (Twin-arginine translocation) pathway signal sequence n=1 Tax=Isoptericola hypogeus TaxID=300179 RepID=A0ABP4UMX6_9MICO
MTVTSSSSSPRGVARRRFLTGAGAAAVAGLAAAGTPATAAPPDDTAAGGPGAGRATANDTPIDSTIASAPASGYVYRHASFFDFEPEIHSAARAWGGNGCYATTGSPMWASIDIPQGARVRDIEWYVYNASATNVLCLGRVWAAGTGTLGTVAVDVQASPGNGIRAFRGVVPSSAYGPFPLGCKLMLGFNSYTGATSQVNGARVGFSNGGGATGMLSTPIRAYDSRATGGRLSAGTTRTITLPPSTCPVGTSAVIVNLIAVGAERSGFLRMWPGHVTDTSTSAINYTKGTTLANAQVVGVSNARKIKLRSSARTHVVIDVLGTIG